MGLSAVGAFDTAPELQLELKIESLFKQQTEALNFVCRCQANINEVVDEQQKIFWRNNLGESRAACCSGAVPAIVLVCDGKHAESAARLIALASHVFALVLTCQRRHRRSSPTFRCE